MASCAASVLFGAITSVGRCSFSTIHAVVALCPFRRPSNTTSCIGLDAACDLLNSRRLVTGRFVIADHLERRDGALQVCDWSGHVTTLRAGCDMCGGGLGTADFARIKVTDRHDPTKVPGARARQVRRLGHADFARTRSLTGTIRPKSAPAGRYSRRHAAHRTHGGIGSGKSTVSAMLADLGAHVIDADAIAREVVALGTEGLAALVEVLGRTSSPLMRHSTGPRWRTKYSPTRQPASASMRSPTPIAARTADLRNIPDDAVFVHDVPLLVEVGLQDAYDMVLVVDAPDEVRVQRLRERGLDEPDAGAHRRAGHARAAIGRGGCGPGQLRKPGRPQEAGRASLDHDRG